MNTIKCKVYELIQCELDSKYQRFNDQRVGIFDCPKSIVNYLTNNGHSSAKLSMLNHNEADQQYLEEYMDDNPNLILVLHREADENPLLGYFCPETYTYYYVQTHEVRAF